MVHGAWLTVNSKIGTKGKKTIKKQVCYNFTEGFDKKSLINVCVIGSLPVLLAPATYVTIETYYQKMKSFDTLTN